MWLVPCVIRGATDGRLPAGTPRVLGAVLVRYGPKPPFARGPRAWDVWRLFEGLLNGREPGTVSRGHRDGTGRAAGCNEG